jgi:hypothetical protein
MKYHVRWLAVLIVVGLIVTACGGGQPQAQPTATREPTKAAAATRPPEPTATPVATRPSPTSPTPTSRPTETPQVKPTNTAVATTAKTAATPEDDGGDTLDDVAGAVTGLENLKTYRTKMSLEVEGIKEGKTVTGTYEILGAYNREQKASRFTVKSAGSLMGDTGAQGSTVEMVQIGTQTWVRFGDQWIQSTGTEDQMMQGMTLSPKEVVGDLEGLQRVRPDEKVNGVDSRHYRFNEKTATKFQSQAFVGLTKYQGDIWIAKGGDEYIVRMILQGEGEKVELFEELENGKVRFTYDVYDVNKPLTIEPPTTAAPTLPGFAEGELPTVEGAEIKLSTGSMIILHTERKPEDVVKFYRESLKDLGWEEEGEPMIAGDVSMLRFKKGEVTLNLMVTVDKGTKKTAVTLTAQK